MRKIIGIGETILDIIFKQEQPTAAVPGGSVFNSLITLGRLGLNASFISETGNDKAGKIVMNFLKENGVDNSHVCIYKDGRTPVSLAWLNENNDAEYEFFKDYPKARLEGEWPDINQDDVVLMGSYFILNPVLRPKVKLFLEYARKNGALIYYDFNFRNTHAAEAKQLYDTLIENIDYADIVRGSTEDLHNMFAQSTGMDDAEQIYNKIVSRHCCNMICTDGGNNVKLFTPNFKKEYGVKDVESVSTIGAGDSFNAGIAYGVCTENVKRADLNNLTEEKWDYIIRCAGDFSAEVCKSFENYISKDFAKQYKQH